MVMISGWTRKIPDADPVHQPDDRRRHQRDERGSQPAEVGDGGGHDVGGHGGDHGDRQVDPAGEHGQRLAGGDDGERDREPQRARHPARRHDARLHDLQNDDEQGEQPEQRDERPFAHPGPGDRHRRSVAGGGDAGGHAVPRRSVTNAPSMTTTTMITPWITGRVRRLHAQEEQIGADEPQDEDADDRSQQSASTPGQAHAAEHDGRDAEQEVRPGDRLPDAGARGQRQPAEGGEEPREGVGDHLRPRHVHAAAEGRQLVRADGVERQPEPRAPQRDPHHADDDEQDDERPRHRVEHEASVDQIVQPLDRVAARRGEHEQRRAGPHEQHREGDDDVGHAADDDERAVHQADEDADEEHDAGRSAPTAPGR